MSTTERIYTDRNYKFVAPIPAALVGSTVLRTANNDKFSLTSDSEFLTFEVNQEVDVFILYTRINTTLEADWLNEENGWDLLDFSVPTLIPGEESDRIVRSQEFPPGRIVLPGNGSTSSLSSMYTLVIKPHGSSGEGFQDELLLSGLNQPIALSFLPDGKMLILHKPGLILITDPRTMPLTTTPYMNITDTDSIRERGLMDITLDPDFENNGYFYVYYRHQPSSRFRLSRFEHTGNTG